MDKNIFLFQFLITTIYLLCLTFQLLSVFLYRIGLYFYILSIYFFLLNCLLRKQILFKNWMYPIFNGILDISLCSKNTSETYPYTSKYWGLIRCKRIDYFYE